MDNNCILNFENNELIILLYLKDVIFFFLVFSLYFTIIELRDDNNNLNKQILIKITF